MLSNHATLILLLTMLALISCEKNKLPSTTESILRNADSFELYSLNPARMETTLPNDFHGWHVLGQVTIEDRAIQKSLLNSLDSGIRATDLKPASCFNPRHAIRATKGNDRVDLLVCFECSQIYMFLNGKKLDTLLVSRAPQASFDGVLRNAAVSQVISACLHRPRSPVDIILNL